MRDQAGDGGDPEESGGSDRRSCEGNRDHEHETRNREGGIGGDGTGYVMLRRVFDEETAENDIVLDDGTPWASPRCRQSSTGSARFPIFFCRILIRRSIFRVNTVVQQFPQFYETYGITEGDGMRLKPEERVPVW